MAVGVHSFSPIMRAARSFVLILLATLIATVIGSPAIGQITYTEYSGPDTPVFGAGLALNGIASGPDRNLWFTEGYAYGDQTSIGKITPSGATSYYPVPTGGSEGEICAGPDGNMWFAEYRGNSIGRIALDGTITEFPIPAGGTYPNGITAGPDGNVWFTSSDGNALVGKITPDGEVTTFPISGTAGIITPGPDGNLWFTENNVGIIGRITTTGVVTEFPVPTADSYPWGIAAGRDGNLWFIEESAGKIGKITPAGDITEFTLPTSGTIPLYIAAGPDGNMWFTEYAGDKIGRITPCGVIAEYATPSPGRLGGIAMGSDGNLWFLELTANKIAKAELAEAAAGNRVVAWGYDAYGQTDVPAGLTGVTAIAAGGFHTVALKADGTVVAWGYNESGQTSVPDGLTGVTAIAAGYFDTVALKSDGTVVAWGYNYSGQTNVPANLTGVTAISAGIEHTVALKSDGTVVAWGADYYGQTDVPADLTGVTAISAGNFHTLALKSDGTVVAWGFDLDGQTDVPAGLTGVTAVSAGYGHSVALKSDGTVVAWGLYSSGATTVPADLTGVTAISAGAYFTAALKSDGTIVAWGNNSAGETSVPGGLSGVTAISAGGFHLAALRCEPQVLSPAVDPLPAITGQCSAEVTTAPTALDASCNAIIGTTTDPLTYSAQGTYTVHWTYNDGSGNTLTQTQAVVVQDTTSPVPDLASLPTVAGACSATVTPPTATDNCVGSVTGTTTDPLTYTNRGTYIVHWNYSDGNGNTSTQTQTVTVGLVPNITYSEFALPSGHSTPYGLTPGPDGNVWFTEIDGNKIGRITPSGTITEFAVPTDGAYLFEITVGSDGNLWFTEVSANQIGRITVSGDVTEFPTPASPFGIAAGPDGNIWFTEIYANRIGRISTSGIVTEFTIPSPDTFPTDITMGPDGNMWFAENHGDNVGMITPNGDITEYPVPTPNAGGVPITTGPDGNLWFGEYFANKIGRVALDGAITEFSTPTQTSPYMAISGITTGPDRNLWFTEPVPSQIGVITPGGTVTEFSTPAADSAPNEITMGPDGALWFTEFSGNRIGKITITNAAPVPDVDPLPVATGQCSVTITNTPTAHDGCGNVIIGTTTDPLTYTSQGTYTVLWTYADGNGNTLSQTQSVNVDRRVVLAFSEYPGPTAPAFLPGLALVDISAGRDGNLWFTEEYAFGAQTDIGRITTAGEPTYTPVPSGSSEGTICAARDGSMWFAEYRANKLGRIGLDGSITEYTIPADGTYPFGITAGPDGNVWFTSSFGNSVVGKATPQGQITTYPISGTAATIVAGRDGNMWFTENNANMIGRITPSGEVTEFSVPTSNSYPWGIAAGSDGNLWFAEESSPGKIGRITTTGAITEFPLPSSGSIPIYVAAGPDGNLWFSEYAGDQIGRITTAGGITEFAAPSPGRQGGITWDPDGNLWFLEVSANKIVKASVRGVAPAPDSNTLPPVTGQCSASITSNPTAHDGCGNAIIGITIDPLTYTAQGTYTVHWTYTDANGTTSTQPQTVIVRDTVRPVITLIGANPVTVPAHGQYTDGGATADDLCAGNLTAAIIVNNPVNVEVPGAYTVTYNVTDPAGNVAAQVTRTVNVISTTPRVTVRLIDSAGAGLAGGKIQYYQGSWKDLGTTGSDGSASIELPAGTYSFSADYLGTRIQKTQNTAANPVVTFQTQHVTVRLIDSTGAGLSGGQVQYYGGSWRDLGTTGADGSTSMELLGGNYSFSVQFLGTQTQKTQSTTTNPVVTFQTQHVTVRLVNSTGVGLSAGVVQYYAGSWRDLGTTGADGSTSIELLGGSYSFSVQFLGTQTQKTQDTTTNPVVTFQTQHVTVRLIDSTGAGLSGSKVQYYAGSWRDLGTTGADGNTSIELLGGSYSFSAQFLGTQTQKTQNTVANPTVVFQTGKVHSTSGACTKYYAVSWRTFTNDMQLLPGTYTFQFTGGIPTQPESLVAGVVNAIP